VGKTIDRGALKRLMKKHGLSCRKVADSIGVSYVQVSRIANYGCPNLETPLAIVDYFRGQLDIHDLSATRKREKPLHKRGRKVAA
jgi:hypothetical protein